jgi:hypothetical protein
MNNKLRLNAGGSLLFLVSAQAQAHTTDSSVGFLHLLSGEHFIMIALAGVIAAGLTRLYRRLR